MRGMRGASIKEPTPYPSPREGRKITRITRIMTEELLLNQMVDEQDLSVRALACLRAAGIKTVRELVRMQKSDIIRLRNVGNKTTIELDDFLYDHKLTWGMDV